MSTTAIKLPIKDQRVEDLLLWKDPVRSGIVFGGLTAVFGLLQFAKINFLSTFAYVGCFLVLGMLLWHTLGGVLKKPPPPVPRILKEGVSDAEVRSHVEKLTPLLNKGLAFGNRLASGREPFLSVAVAGVLYLIAKVSASLSILGLAYMGVVAAFAGPKVYEMRKDEIDAAVDTARKHSTAVYDKYLHPIAMKIPKATAAKPAESSSAKKAE